MTRPWHSIATQLALMFALLVLLAFGLTGWAMFERLANEIAHEQVHAQRSKLKTVLAMLERARGGGRVSDQWAQIAQELEVLHRADRATRYWVFCQEGTDSACHPDRPALSGLSAAVQGHRLRFADAGLEPVSANSGDTLWALSIELAGLPPSHRVQLVATRDDAAVRASLRRFAWEVGAISLTAALLTAVLGSVLSRRALKPVRVLSASAAMLGPEQLERRLDLPAASSELYGLACAFNAALDRMHSAFQQLETFNANVAHELRTPLNTLIGITQVALSKPRTAPELKEVMTANLEDCERLATLVRDMLFLAHADHGLRVDTPHPTALHDLARDTAEFFEPLLQEHGLTLNVSGQATARVDPGLIKRALSNLVANAVQYGDPGKPIEIALRTLADTSCELVVSNHGPALPASTLAHMFDRFYRADGARHCTGGHAGLGLAIVRAVALMHGARVLARCDHGRVEVGLHLR